MGAAFFYHLTRSTAETTLRPLIEKALGQGWRVVVRGRVDEAMARLDLALWEPPDSFLPHGLAGGAHDAEQPVLLTTGGDMPNGARCLMSIDGAEVSTSEAASLARTCILFDGEDAAAVEAARAQWRTLTGGGIAAEYWNQSQGGWTCQARSGAD